VPLDNPTEIVGFYTLSSTGVRLSDMPPDVIRRLPRYPTVPATLLGRLAVSLEHRGARRGEQLLIDALDRSLAASTRVGSVAVIVDAKDEDGVAFYEKYGFTRFAEHRLRLFMMMASIEQLLEGRR
jgi:predicted GNAT family N-acyltransferase